MFNKNISFLRKNKNITQEDLAKALNVSRQTISKWEKGEVVPDSYNLIEISKYFSIKVQDLIMADLTISINNTSKEVISEANEENNIVSEPLQLENKSNIKSKFKSKPLIIVFVCLIFIGLIFVYINRDQLFNKNDQNIIEEPIVGEEVFEDDIIEIDYSKLISAGRDFSVYIDSNGSVKGIGDNTYKQLEFASWTDIMQISAGGFHTLGLKSDGTVLSTGYNNLGQTNVSSWNDITQVSAGRYHSLGLISDGSVVCVGENEYDQCNVGDWTNIIQVSAGRYNSYGLKNDGSVVSTSDNEYGQAKISTWTDIKQISSGTYQVLGLMNDGTVVCAGGQKSDGACNVSSWTDIKQVVGAGYHSIGLKNDGTVVAVGNNEKGQLDVSIWKDVVAVSGGRYHTIGIKKDNTFLSLGLNENIISSNNSNNSNENNDDKGMIKYRLVGSSSYQSILVTEKGNNISNIKYLEDEYRIEFKSKAKHFLLKFTTIEGLEYIAWFSNSDEDSDDVLKDIYNELLMVLRADQNTHKDQKLKISISEMIDANDSNKGFTKWFDLNLVFNAKEEFSQLFAKHGQVQMLANGDLETIYPGRFDVSQFKSGSDLDLTYGFDYSYWLFNSDNSEYDDDYLNILDYLSDFNSAYGSSNVPDNFELNKTFYLCNSVNSIDGTGFLTDSNTKLITNCAPFALNSVKLGITPYPNGVGYGEINFTYSNKWMFSKADNNFLVTFIIKDLKYVNEIRKELSFIDLKGFTLNVIDELKKDIIIDSSTPNEFLVNIYVSAKSVGNYLESKPFEYKLILKKSDFVD